MDAERILSIACGLLTLALLWLSLLLVSGINWPRTIHYYKVLLRELWTDADWRVLKACLDVLTVAVGLAGMVAR